jgi:hypothetical protein
MAGGTANEHSPTIGTARLWRLCDMGTWRWAEEEEEELPLRGVDDVKLAPAEVICPLEACAINSLVSFTAHGNRYEAYKDSVSRVARNKGNAIRVQGQTARWTGLSNHGMRERAATRCAALVLRHVIVDTFQYPPPFCPKPRTGDRVRQLRQTRATA